jgi:arylsulfatase A-like enzyme
MSVASASRRMALSVTVAAVALLVLSGHGAPRAGRRSVILLVLDTLRADHLGLYGYGRNTSPHLDAFARENVAFRYAFTAAPWTLPSVTTMFTGLYPSAHGPVPLDTLPEVSRARKFAPGLLTLAQVLGQRGYRTAAVSSNPWITPTFGFDQGFGIFEYLGEQPAGRIVQAATALVGKLSKRDEPFFLYLHFLDPHDPYAPPEPYGRMFTGRLPSEVRYDDEMQRNMRRYDGEIRYLDDEIGRFFAFLKERRLYDRALIVVVADHGEQFREHGAINHGNSLHNEEVRVPLFIRDPLSRRRAEVVETVVSTVDLFPTVLGQLGIPVPRGQRDGLSVFDRQALAARAGVLSEVRAATDQRAFIGKDRRKAIFEVPLLPPDREGQRAELWRRPGLQGVYDIATDSLEQRPLHDGGWAARTWPTLELAFARVDAGRGSRESAPPTELSEDVRERLRMLGYLN